MKNFVARTTSSAVLERLADDLLGRAGRVDVGRVDEVDPGIERAVEDAGGVIVVGVAPGAEHHRAEAELQDLDAGAFEVRDADPARRPPVGEERLGRLVGADGVLEVAGHRLIQQIQIDVVEAEPAQAGAKPTCAAS
jgi:hypothetical protein